MNQRTDYTKLDLGSSAPTTPPLETIEVYVSSQQLMADYARAFVREGWRVNPDLAKQVALTEDEMVEYAKFLLLKRLECVHGTCSDYRRLKVLYIPCFLQLVLSKLGEVIDRGVGLRFVPMSSDETSMTLAEAIKVSEKVGCFERELQIVRDAMPRDIAGDIDVMTQALIAGYACSYRERQHPLASYIAIFLEMKLQETVGYAISYRRRFDEVEYVRAALNSQREVFH